MKTYLVGGAVRDQLLGITPRDFDYLVIDSSPEEMKKLGFIQVGASYEVFLHPETRYEYVLATSLEQDLKRRDLTINAMAFDQDGKLYDPFNGQEDLNQKVLKHTSEHFADDPLRVYRLARFKAQFPDFTIHPDTLSLAKTIDTRNLNGERISGELKRALVAKKPEEFFNTLAVIGIYIVKDWSGLNQFRDRQQDVLIIFAYLVRTISEPEIMNISNRLLIQNDWIEAGRVSSKIYSLRPLLNDMNAQEMVTLFYEIDAFRKPDLVNMLEKIFETEGMKLAADFKVVSQVTVKDIAPGLKGKEIGIAIRNERIKRLIFH